jgi:hypothetical protein
MSGNKLLVTDRGQKDMQVNKTEEERMSSGVPSVHLWVKPQKQIWGLGA